MLKNGAKLSRTDIKTKQEPYPRDIGKTNSARDSEIRIPPTSIYLFIYFVVFLINERRGRVELWEKNGRENEGERKKRNTDVYPFYDNLIYT